MGHPFIIESDDVFAMAAELAALTGETLAGAVTLALRDKLALERAQRGRGPAHLQERDQRLARVQAIMARVRPSIQHPFSSSDVSSLYDENGLPV